ncbi:MULTISPECIES: NUDIX hydrolase [Rhizobium]|jgi:ADP-ribose pyrophosphatase|nr:MULTISPECIES: NUDIX hydrolase [Rhizobium]ASR08159.1 NUDIX hydrolase [Rhizobium leguminosarum bv. viciae]MBY3247046.1 NUDIX hydrolase [Rhizobium laguerreae]MBY5749712.1 NUDIX hydrolase [Rhizobium leguminosarum]MBY5776356.1 NUDIX hydrolase [Rhizobium leguminosarum]MBY5799943.1 NUDIX hydrolase [Rhizobium leguminosarum]
MLSAGLRSDTHLTHKDGPMNDELKPWSVTASRITYEDRWIRVRSDDCITADGIVVAPFHVLDYPDWINVIPVMPDGRVLLTREYRHGRGEIVLGLVAGSLEPGDSKTGDAAMAAAERELREETGYQASTFVKLLTSYPNAASHSNMVTSWLALGLSRAGEPSFDPGEKVELLFADLAAILGELQSGAVIMQSMHVAALYAAESWLRRQASEGLK